MTRLTARGGRLGGTAPSNCIVKPNSSRFAGICSQRAVFISTLLARAECIVPFAYAAPTQAPMLVVERYDRKPGQADAPIDGSRAVSPPPTKKIFAKRLAAGRNCNISEGVSQELARSMADALRRYASTPSRISCGFDLIAFNFITVIAMLDLELSHSCAAMD